MDDGAGRTYNSNDLRTVLITTAATTAQSPQIIGGNSLSLPLSILKHYYTELYPDPIVRRELQVNKRDRKYASRQLPKRKRDSMKGNRPLITIRVEHVDLLSIAQHLDKNDKVSRIVHGKALALKSSPSSTPTTTTATAATDATQAPTTKTNSTTLNAPPTITNSNSPLVEIPSLDGSRLCAAPVNMSFIGEMEDICVAG